MHGGLSSKLGSISPHLTRIHKHLISVLPHMLPLLVPPERFPHIKGVRIIVVVVYYAAVDGVSVAKSAFILPLPQTRYYESQWCVAPQRLHGMLECSARARCLTPYPCTSPVQPCCPPAHTGLRTKHSLHRSSSPDSLSISSHAPVSSLLAPPSAP